jgi:hypothetical protein
VCAAQLRVFYLLHHFPSLAARLLVGEFEAARRAAEAGLSGPRPLAGDDAEDAAIAEAVKAVGAALWGPVFGGQDGGGEFDRRADGSLLFAVGELAREGRGRAEWLRDFGPGGRRSLIGDVAAAVDGAALALGLRRAYDGGCGRGEAGTSGSDGED